MEVLLVLQVVVVVALIAVILVQKSTSDGFTGGSSPNSFLTGRATANLFTRATSILATIFIVNSLVLAYIASHTERGSSIIEQASDEATKEKAANPEAAKKSDSLGDLQKKLDANLQPKKADEKAEDKKDGAETKEAAPAKSGSVPVSE